VDNNLGKATPESVLFTIIIDIILPVTMIYSIFTACNYYNFLLIYSWAKLLKY